MTPRFTIATPAPAAPAATALSCLGAGRVLPVSTPPKGLAPASVGLAASRPAGAVALLTWQALLGDAGAGGGALDDDTLQALDSLAQLRTVAPGQPVLCCGRPATTLLALHSGEVALGLRSADGVLRTERILRGPAWLDLSAAWLGQPQVVDAQALSAASVLDLPCDLLRQHLPRLPALAVCLLAALAREVRLLALNTQALMHKDAPARLAQWLHAHSVPLPLPAACTHPALQPGGATAQALVRLQERKRDLASQLAITPETLSRLMRSFSRAGVIEVCGYDVRVLDLAALARLAQG